MSRAKEEEQVATFSLDLGIDNTALAQSVQPPLLVSSVNTRLSVTRGVSTRAPDVELLSSATGPCIGIVPCGHVDSSIAFFLGANKRITGSAVTDYLDGGTRAAGIANLSAPVQVTRAGVMPCGEAWVKPSIAYDSENYCIWTAAARLSDNGSDSTLYVSAMSTSGRLLCQPTAVATVTGASPQTAFPLVEVTAHVDFGVLLWYVDNASNAVHVRSVTLASLVATISAPVTVYTPVNTGSMAVVAGEDGYAYIACFDSATLTTLTVHKVAVSTRTVTATLSKTTYIAAGAKIDISYRDGTLLVGVSASAGGVNALCVSTSVMTETWSTTGITGSSLTTAAVRVAWMVLSGTTYALIVLIDRTASVSSGTIAGSHVRVMSAASGATVSSYAMPWMVPVSSPVSVAVGSQSFPLLQVQRHYADTTSATADEYITDPSNEVMLLGLYSASCVARIGVDESHCEGSTLVSSSCMIVYDESKVTVTYRQREYATFPDGMTVRYAELDFAAWNPSYVLTDDGSAIIACACPMLWDGTTLTELAPLHRPTINVTQTGGSAPSLAAGVYRFAAVHGWRDACGVLHRSMPSRVDSITAGASDEPIVSCAVPTTARDGVKNERFRTDWYVSLTGGTVLYRTDISLLARGSFWDSWTYVPQPAAGADNPAIYSDGDPSQPLMAQCPPAASDVCLVGRRCWLIEAERPNILWPSKLREQGVAYEWSSDIRLYLQSSCGRAVALEEFQGQLVVLTDTGAFIINGQGPDNLGRGEWSDAQKVSDIPCTSRASAVSTPVGVMYQANGRFVVLGKGEVPNIDASAMGQCVSSVLSKAQQEVLFIGSILTYVYNYSLDRWTTWEHLPAPSCAALTSAGRSGLDSPSGLVLHSSDALYLVDLDTTSLTAQMSWSTGDVTFGGPQDDCVVSDVLIHGRIAGSHGLVVTLTPDYGQGTAVAKTFSASDISAASANGQYTLSCLTGTHSMRAIKIHIQETDAYGQGAQITSVSILVTKHPGTKRDAVKPAGRK